MMSTHLVKREQPFSVVSRALAGQRPCETIALLANHGLFFQARHSVRACHAVAIKILDASRRVEIPNEVQFQIATETAG